MARIIRVVILAVFSLSICGIAAAEGSSAQVGDPCDGRVTRWCDFDAALWCRSDKCRCVHNYMYFDPNRQKCLSKVWFPCGDLSSADTPMPNIECVDNAQCVPGSPNAECRCNRGFQENDDGFCVPQRVLPLDKDSNNNYRVQSLLGADWSRTV